MIAHRFIIILYARFYQSSTPRCWVLHADVQSALSGRSEASWWSLESLESRILTHARSRHTVRSLISEKSFLLTHCPQIYIRKEISRSGFLHVSRYSVVHSIDLRRVFLRYVNISMCKGDLMAVCHARGCMVGCMGRISHTNLKNRMVISGVATSKNHIELLVPGQIWDRIRDPQQIMV